MTEGSLNKIHKMKKEAEMEKKMRRKQRMFLKPIVFTRYVQNADIIYINGS